MTASAASPTASACRPRAASGGGIVAVVPGKAAITVWSPELDRFGTSVVGTAALERFAQLTTARCSVL
jgi:glutaminase